MRRMSIAKSAADTGENSRIGRRALLRGGAFGLGAAALANLLLSDMDRGTAAEPANSSASGASLSSARGGNSPSSLAPHFAPQVKRVIYLFMHGGPSSIDTMTCRCWMSAGEVLVIVTRAIVDIADGQHVSSLKKRAPFAELSANDALDVRDVHAPRHAPFSCSRRSAW